MAGTGFHALVTFRAPIPRIATIGIIPWQKPHSSALRIAKPSAQVARQAKPVAIRSQI
jgi:hypothetical protein